MPDVFDIVAEETRSTSGLEDEGDIFDQVAKESEPGIVGKAAQTVSGLANRVGEQVWNAFPAAIAHGLGGSDVDPAAAEAWNAQQRRIKSRPEKLTGKLLDDEYDDIVRQLHLPPAVREKDLKDLPQFKAQQNPFAAEVAPPKNLVEKGVDIGAGVAGFVGQIALMRKTMPPGTSEPAVWEAANLASGGPVGEGAAMGGVFSAIRGIPAISKAGKALKISAESAALGGMTAIKGGDTQDIIISSLIPVAFAGYSAAKGRMTDKAIVKQWQEQLPFTRDIDRKSSLKMARAMRANWEVQQTKDPALREKQIRQAYKKYGPVIDDFLKKADMAFKAAGAQPEAPRTIKGLLAAPQAQKIPTTTPTTVQEARTTPGVGETTPEQTIDALDAQIAELHKAGQPIPKDLLAEREVARKALMEQGPSFAGVRTQTIEGAAVPITPPPPKSAAPSTPAAVTTQKDPIVYHGTEADVRAEDIEPDKGMKGIYTTTSPEVAKTYGKNVLAYNIKPDAKVLDLSDGEMLWSFMEEHGILEADDLENEDLRNYINSGRTFQYDIDYKTRFADDVVLTAKSLGYDVVRIPDVLPDSEDNIANVVINKKVMTPTTPPTETGAEESPIVYHGTEKEFVDFDKTLADPRDAGIWFHENETVARGYGTKGPKGTAQIISARLDIKKPFVVYDRDIKLTPGKIEELKSQGYDGVKRILEGEGVEWAVFEPTQIKTVGKTRETYDEFVKRTSQPAPAKAEAKAVETENDIASASESEQDLKDQADNPELPFNRNRGMVIIPPQVEEVLESLSRPVGAVKGIPGVARYVINGAADYVEKQYKIPEGKQLAESIRRIAKNTDTRSSTQHRRIYKDAGLKTLTKKEKILLWKAAQGRIPRSQLSKKAQRIFDDVHLIVDEDIDVANEAGIKRKVGNTYKTLTRTNRWGAQIPNQKGRHILYWARQKGLGHPKVMKAAEDMVKMGSAKDLQDALDKMIKHREMSHVSGALRGVDGNLESTRTLLPDNMVEFNPDIVLPKILGTNAKMIAAAQEWNVPYEGQPFNFKKVEPLLAAIRTKYGSGDAESLRRWMGTTFGRSNDIPSGVENILDYLSNGLTRLKLSNSLISAIRNGFQGFGNTFMVSPTDSLRSFLYSLEITPEGKRISEIVRRSGAMSHAKEFAELVGGGDQPKGMIPFLAAEHRSQREAGIAGVIRFKTNVQRLADLRKGSALDKILVHLKLLSVRPEAYLTDLLKNRTFTNPITDEQLDEFLRDRAPTLDEVQQFAWRLVNDTQFPMNLASRPIPLGNPAFRFGTKFKYYAVNQTRLVWREAVLQALKGTVAPLLQFLIRSALIGELWNLLRDLVRGGDNSITSQLVNREEKRNAKDLLLAIGNDILDGTGIGIVSDLGYGIGTTIGGVAVSTGRNIGGWLAESVTGHPAIATRKLLRQEVVALKDVSGLMNRADAWFVNENNKYFEYQRWRDRSFDFQDKKQPALKRVGKYARKVLLGRPAYSSILPYEYAARQVTVGDMSDAADYLAAHIEDNPEKKRSELRTNIESSARQYAPFAGIADKDVNRFLAQFDAKTRDEGRKLQRDWLADYRKATRLAFEKAGK